MTIRLAQAMMVLGLLSSEQMPQVAIKALEEGEDFSALRILAGLTGDEYTEAPRFFERALEELAFPALSRSAAARIYTIAICEQIMSGQLSPQDGASRIWDASVRTGDPDFHDLDSFIYAASELQDRPEDRDFFEREIVKEAHSRALRSAG